MIEGNSVFIGIPSEHEDFEKTFGIKVPFRPVNDFLEMANIINGAELFVGNQGFAYSLAIGLGKTTVLEVNKLVPLHMSECVFQRTNTQYF
jgi:ADP-heptose:LPS heptosyltransferase